MTNAEKQEIIEAVLAALATNSKTIAQLSPKQSLIDSDMFEVAGGSRVTYQTLRSLIREGLALESQLSNYVTGDAAMMYLAKLDTETGTVDYKESPLVMLDGFKGVNGYTPVTGDLYYENWNGYQIWIKTQGGTQGVIANTNVAYVNKNDGAIYRWTGSSMVRIGGSAVINDLVTGGEADALSAEMGKTLRAAILAIYNALGAYAFPEGKPTLNWNSGVVKHSITATLTNLTPSETIPAEVTDNDGLEITLNLPSNLYVIDDDNLVITMGGQNIESTAYDESTGKITIEHVTGAVVIEAAAITYVQDGLVLHLDCKHRGGVGSEVSGHWKSLVNYNGSPLDFTLGSGVTAADTGMVFDGGSNSYGETDDSLDVAADSATIEGVFNGATQEYNPVLINPTVNMIGLILYNYNTNKKISTIWMSRTGNGTTVNNSSLAVGTTAASETDFAMSQSVSRFMNKGVSSTPSEHDAFLMNALHTKLTIGRARRSGDFAFTGTIKAIRVYSAVLTEAQQLQNWKVDKKRFNIS